MDSLVERREQYGDVRELPVSVVDTSGQRTEGPAVDFIAESWLGARAVVVHDVLTREECKQVVDFFESCQITEKCHTRTDYRNNYRVVASNVDVAAEIFRRIQPFLSVTDEVSEVTGEFYNNNGVGMYGTWRIDHLNPCFRICKYDPDGHFAPHYDGDFVQDANLRSLKTFMIYLNDEYEGGETNFLSNHGLHFDEATKRYRAPPEAVRAGLKARRGDALIFDHNILHEGATVRAGYKYIMRCEVVYRRDAPDLTSMTPEARAQYEREVKAHEYLREAQRLEADRREMEAVEYYRKAFKLLPALENC
jgi:hypothetical protein